MYVFLLCIFLYHITAQCVTSNNCTVPELCAPNNLCSLKPCSINSDCEEFPYDNRCLVGFCDTVGAADICNVTECSTVNPNNTCFNQSIGCERACTSHIDCNSSSSPSVTLFCVNVSQNLSLCRPIVCSDGNNSQCPSSPYAPINNCSVGICNSNNTCFVGTCVDINKTCSNDTSLGCVTVTPSPTSQPTVQCVRNEDCLPLDPDHVLFCNDHGLCATIPCTNDTQCEPWPYEGNKCVIGGCDLVQENCYYLFCEEFGQVCLNTSIGCVEPTEPPTTTTTITDIPLASVVFVVVGLVFFVGLFLWCIALASSSYGRRRTKPASRSV